MSDIIRGDIMIDIIIGYVWMISTERRLSENTLLQYYYTLPPSTLWYWQYSIQYDW